MWQSLATHFNWRRGWHCAALYVVLASLFAGVLLVGPSAARACTTPVYRYAMYNWAPTPYFVCYFHYGEPAEEHTELHQVIDELTESQPAAANVVLKEIDLSLGHFDQLPGPVQEAWLSYVRTEARAAEPVHLVFTSWLAELHAGRLDVATLREMIDSPARTRIGELLEEGCAAVIVFLPGSDEAENERAEKVARELIARAGAGEIPIEAGFLDASFAQYGPPPGAAGEAPPGDVPSEEERVAAASRLKVGFVKVSRSDAAEQWLVRSLTAIEPDLGELSEHPMIFFSYGRGRAMPPYVGKGINPDNLAGEIQFLGSACSCFVKEQNPGVDLLMQWDWEAVADAMAAKDPSMSGDLYAYQEFSPGEVGDAASQAEPEAVGGASTVAASPPEADYGSPPSNDAGGGSESSQTSEEYQAASQPPEAGVQPAVAETSSESLGGIRLGSTQPDRSGSFASKQMWILGIALVVGAVLVLGAGSVLVRKRAAYGERPI